MLNSNRESCCCRVHVCTYTHITYTLYLNKVNMLSGVGLDRQNMFKKGLLPQITHTIIPLDQQAIMPAGHSNKTLTLISLLSFFEV